MRLVIQFIFYIFFLFSLSNITFAENNGLTPEQKHRAELLTSLFENGTIIIDYAYIEALNDGRGYTAGRAGFTSATGDMYEVVKIYTNKKPDNILAKYLPTLKKLAESENADISKLGGLKKDWATAAKDPLFRSAQDQVVDEMYYQPAMNLASKIGLVTPLAKAQLYDAIIQHGEGNDLDGLPALISRTNKLSNGTPKTGVDEKIWLANFLKTRRADLAHAYNKETREVWAESVSRVDVYSEIAKSGNYNLNGPIKIQNSEYEGEIIP